MYGGFALLDHCLLSEYISFLKLCLLSRLSKLSKLVFHTNAALSQWSFLFLLVCTFKCMFSYFFFVGEKVSYRYIISLFEKSSDLDSMKIQALFICETSSPLLLLVWMTRSKLLISKKSLEIFLSLPSICRRKKTKNPDEQFYLRTPVRKQRFCS